MLVERLGGRAPAERLAWSAVERGSDRLELVSCVPGEVLPLVLTSRGKEQVPVQTLLSLYEATHSGEEGSRQRYPLKPAMARQRRAAERIRMPPASGQRHLEGHDRARARSLAYHRVLAKRLTRPMVQEARHTLLRWGAQERIHPRYAEQWEAILERPIPEIRGALISEDQTGDDLRQNSPFAGMLSEPERQRALQLG